MRPITELKKEHLKKIKMIVFDVDGVLVRRGTKIKQVGNTTTLETKVIATRQIEQIHELNKKGFLINSQVPLQRNVNIFIEDFDKTMDLLYQLAQLQGISGVRSYKYILHMNFGSLEYSVPLEFMLDVLAELKYRLDHPWPETWQPISYSILCQKGNILLSPQMLYIIKKEVHEDKDCVVYHIPVPMKNRKWEIVEYTEPILKGYNDNPKSLEDRKI